MLVIILSFVLQFMAYYLSRNHNAYYYDALSVAAVILVVLFSLIEKNLFYSRMIGVSFLMLCWGGRLMHHLFNRAEADVKNTMHEHNHMQYVTSRWVWTLAVSACPIFLNLAYDYGVHPGLFRQPEDMFLFASALMCIGLAWWADRSKRDWHAVCVRTTTEFCRVGPWAWSRHPNYFAEVFFHVCIYGLSARHVPLVCVLGLLFTVYICIFTPGGIVGMEKRRFNMAPYNKAMMEYRRAVSVFYPIAPSLYRYVPFSARRVFFMDWSVFNQVEELKIDFLPLSSASV